MYTESSTIEGLYTTETPKVKESKVEKSKVKESKEEKSKVNVVGVVSNDFLLVRDFYENNIGTLSSTVMDTINYYLDEGIQAELIVESIKVSCMNNKRSMSYAEGVLKNWLKNGINTVEQYKSSVVERSEERRVGKEC